MTAGERFVDPAERDGDGGPTVVRARAGLWPLCAFLGTLSVATLGSATTPVPEERQLLAWMVILIVAGFLGCIAIRIGRSAIIVTTEGIRVRNPVRAHVLLWSAVDRFAVRQERNGAEMATVHTVDGRVIAAFGVQGPTRAIFRDYTGVEDRVAWLNDELARRRRVAVE